MRAIINERLVRRLTEPVTIMDTRIFGFGVRRSKGGRISFFVRKVCGGRDRRKVIGTFPNMSVKAAKELAASTLTSWSLMSAERLIPHLAPGPMERVDIVDQLKRLETKLDRVTPPPEKTCDLLFKDLVAQIHGEYFRKKKERTRVTYQRYIDSVLLPEFGECTIDELTAERLEKWHSGFKGVLGGRPTQPRKILMSLLALGEAQKLIPKVPSPKFVEDWVSEEREPFPPATVERIDAYYTRRISSPDVHVSEFAIWVGIHTGERAEALASLAVDEVDFRTRKVTKRRKGKKGKDVYSLTYNDEVIGVLRQLKAQITGRYFFPRPNRPGDHVTAQMVRRHFQRDCKNNHWVLPKGGQPCLHTLRHTLITYLAHKKVSVPVIAALAGHRDIATTLQYIHPVEEAAREATNNCSIGSRRRKRKRSRK